MAQATIVKLMGNRGDRVQFKCADASAIALGDICVLSDPMTVTAATAAADVPVVGVCAREKVANDGELFVTVITNAIIKVTVVAGGSHATALHQQILKRIPGVDVVVRGEGDITFRDYILTEGHQRVSSAFFSRLIPQQ